MERIPIKDKYKTMQMKSLQEADKYNYNYNKCQQIQKNTEKIRLPKLTLDEMTTLKNHLTNYKKIENKDKKIEYDFLNLHNCFLLINEFEEDPELTQKIQPILDYLQEYQYIINQIIETLTQKKEHPLLDKSLLQLNLQINKFTMKYEYLLNDTNTTPNLFKDININYQEKEEQEDEE